MQACVAVIDGLLRREMLRGAWLDLTAVDEKYGMCAKEHLELLIADSTKERGQCKADQDTGANVDADAYGDEDEGANTSEVNDTSESDSDKRCCRAKARKVDKALDLTHARELVENLFETCDKYKQGGAFVKPVNTALLSHSSVAAVRRQDHLVSSDADRRETWIAYGKLLIDVGHYYSDVVLDVLVIHKYTQPKSAQNPAGEHWPLMWMSVAAIVLSLIINVAFDDSDSDNAFARNLRLGAGNDEEDVATDCCGGCTKSRAKCCRCRRWTWTWKVLRNVLHFRMVDEAVTGFRYIKNGYKVPASMRWLHVSEGLFEATPQSVLQVFVVAKLMFLGIQPTRVQLASVMSSTLSIGKSVSSIGSNETSDQWKAAFALFAMTQAILRVWTLCGFVLYLQDNILDENPDLTPSWETVVYALGSLIICFVSAYCMVRGRHILLSSRVNSSCA